MGMCCVGRPLYIYIDKTRKAASTPRATNKANKIVRPQPSLPMPPCPIPPHPFPSISPNLIPVTVIPTPLFRRYRYTDRLRNRYRYRYINRTRYRYSPIILGRYRYSILPFSERPKLHINGHPVAHT